MSVPGDGLYRCRACRGKLAPSDANCYHCGHKGADFKEPTPDVIRIEHADHPTFHVGPMGQVCREPWIFQQHGSEWERCVSCGHVRVR